jgi:hypothetical protein
MGGYYQHFFGPSSAQQLHLDIEFDPAHIAAGDHVNDVGVVHPFLEYPSPRLNVEMECI